MSLKSFNASWDCAGAVLRLARHPPNPRFLEGATAYDKLRMIDLHVPSVVTSEARYNNLLRLAGAAGMCVETPEEFQFTLREIRLE